MASGIAKAIAGKTGKGKSGLIGKIKSKLINKKGDRGPGSGLMSKLRERSDKQIGRRPLRSSVASEYKKRKKPKGGGGEGGKL